MRQEESAPLEIHDTPRPLRVERAIPNLPAGELAHRRSENLSESAQNDDAPFTESSRRIELREEQLVAEKELVDLGEIVIRTAVDEVPGRIEVEAIREEAEVEHVPVGQVVTERVDPWEEDGVLVIPLYEEQLVVVKRLYLREQLRIRRIGTTARQVFEDTLRQERLVIEDAQATGLVHEVFPRDEADDGNEHREPHERPGFLQNVVRKAFE
jgi:uncharacterized protein (TIGR02271 family)